MRELVEHHPHADDDRRCAAEGARERWSRSSRRIEKRLLALARQRRPGAPADDHAWRGRDRGADLRLGDRRSGPVPLLAHGRGAFRSDAEEVSVRRDRCDRADLQDRRPWRARGALRGGERDPDAAGEGLGPEELGAGPWPSAPACARRRWRWPASWRSCCTAMLADGTTFSLTGEAAAVAADDRLGAIGGHTRFGRARHQARSERGPVAGTMDPVRPLDAGAALRMTARP